MMLTCSRCPHQPANTHQNHQVSIAKVEESGSQYETCALGSGWSECCEEEPDHTGADHHTHRAGPHRQDNCSQPCRNQEIKPSVFKKQDKKRHKVIHAAIFRLIITTEKDSEDVQPNGVYPW